ncbi:GAF domain-containing sensor histidine kinase [Actinoalloteichus hymeniacidonis]|nr:GAF domain-containing sensor histidine kinase [Actinoalloteichus hymeniacidonis]MBB5911037.1 signal transduction histidine kinase [Actinoalloteichus hymeniacidonis]
MDPSLAGRTLAAATGITTAALSGDDPDLVLPMVVEQAVGLTGADLGLAMVRSDDGTLTVEAAHRSDGGPLDSAAQSVDPVGAVLSARSAAARVARGGVPVVVDELTADPRTAPFVPKALRGYGPFAVAPFGTLERRLGALAVYRRKGASGFAAETVEVLTAFAAQAGLALVLAEGTTARRRVAVYQERERIARDLHDVIVQRLYAAGMQLDLLGRGLGNRLAPTESQRLSETVDQLDLTIEEIRATVRALRSADPGEPASTGLADSVRAEAETAGELLGVAPIVELTGALDEVPTSVADHARAAIREALSNVVRHSGASRVVIRLGRDAAGLRVQVVDNGCGIPPGVSRRGLRHLEERARAAGGHCTVRSSARTGTDVTWVVPLP